MPNELDTSNFEIHQFAGAIHLWRLLVILVVVSMAGDTVAADKPNVVFFLVDDLGWTELGCYDSSFYKTPHVDRLASEGVRFTDAYAACHVCSPIRASIMTGKYSARTGLTDWIPGRRDFPFLKLNNASNRQQLPLAEVALAESLKAHGYAAAHFGTRQLKKSALSAKSSSSSQKSNHQN